MKDLLSDEFQNLVNDTLIRHHGLLDIMTKFSESAAKTNRAVVKSVTGCGCIQIDAKKVSTAETDSIQDLKLVLDKHSRGELCPDCNEKISQELGKLMFYVTALCNNLDISLYDVLLQEYKKIRTLGSYNLT